MLFKSIAARMGMAMVPISDPDERLLEQLSRTVPVVSTNGPAKGLLEQILRGDLRFDNITDKQIQILEEHYSINPVSEDVVLFLSLLACPSARGNLVPDSINNRAVDALLAIYKSLTDADRRAFISYLELASHKANIGDLLYTIIERFKGYRFMGGDNVFNYKLPIDFRMAIVINPGIIRNLAAGYYDEVRDVLKSIEEILEELKKIDEGKIKSAGAIERQLTEKQVEFFIRTDTFLSRVTQGNFPPYNLFANTIIFEVRPLIGGFAEMIFCGEHPYKNIDIAEKRLIEARRKIEAISNINSIDQVHLTDSWKGPVIDL